jgi:hypothetical protein
MGKRQTYIVNDEVFKTKKELQEHIRNIVKSYKNREKINNQHFIFMLELLKNHPHYQTKIGCGVQAMYIAQNPVYRQNRTFYLVRFDNSETDFSWTECLKPTSKRQKIMHAFRVLVKHYILEFKDNFLKQYGDGAICEITGESISFNDCHVDHKSPKTFEVLFETFIEKNDINLETIDLKNEQADNKYQDEIVDESLASLWIKYHNTHAELRVISPLANLSHVKSKKN